MKESGPGSPRIVDMFALAQSQDRVEGHTRLAAMDRLAPLLAGTHGELAWEVVGSTDFRGRPAAVVRVHGTVLVNCDRCGLRLELPIETDSRFWFVQSEEELNEQPIDVDDSEPLLGSRHFVVEDLIEDEVILALPISPRHPHCAISNEPAKEPDHRRPFAALARLKSRH